MLAHHGHPCCCLCRLRLLQLLTNLGFQEFIPNRLTAPLIISLCPVFPIDELCAAAISFFTFGPSIFITPDDYITIATTWPSGVGIRNFNHWAQVRSSL